LWYAFPQQAKDRLALDGATSLVHGTCIALDDRAALLTGPSGSGKSDLALRCMMTPLPGSGNARLVADDQVIVERRGARLVARAPDTIKGRLEVRGLGVLEFPYLPQAEIRLVVRFARASRIERLADPGEATDLVGVRLPVLYLAPFEASAPLKLLLALEKDGWWQGS
jgi:serine kinase of HPr protein (carbohydrate metabolism regulator)